MHPPGADTVLVRHGEIGVKSAQVQAKMERRLRNNLAAVLADRDVEGTVERERTRLYVTTTEAAVEAATDAATDTFGVVSASPARVVDPTTDAIYDALAETARARYDGGSFAVRARRAGETDAHDFASPDLESDGGAAVWEAAEAVGLDPSVDLENPDVTFFVEARPDRAFVFLEKRAGPGGMPVGTQRPLVALVSGGIDSPVAAWLAMKRGAPVYPLYVDLGEYGGVDHRARAERTVETLQRSAPHLDLHLGVASGGDGVDHIVDHMDDYRMLGLRRFMFRIAEYVAADLEAVGIVSGEAIGQKSSQTTANLAVTSAVTDLPVHRPLLTMDKTAITDIARELGTFADATISAGCNRVAPTYPETNASLAVVRDREPSGIDDLARRAAASASFERIRASATQVTEP
ncbi:tRNA sulfurtransferase [Halobacteriales archaeon Cl-PHB]